MSQDPGMVFAAMVLGLVLVWIGAAIVLALLTGGMIHERDVHDRPAQGRARSTVAL